DVFHKLVVIVSLGHHRNKSDVERNAVRPIVAHRANQLAVAERMISRELDFPDFDFRSLVNLEYKNDGVARRNSLVLRGHLRELPAVLAEQFAQNNFRLLDLRGIELAFYR